MIIGSSRLLIVEDEAVVAADLEARLVRIGYTVCGIAASGAEAIDLAHEHRPDLALMDIRIQGDLDGVETAETLRKELDVPAIFLTAHSDDATFARAKLSSPYGFVVKPFDVRELRLHIEVALQQHEGERQLLAAHREIRDLNADLERRVHERTADLESALTEIENVVHAVAHHFHSPLRAIEAYSHLLLGQADGIIPQDVSDFPALIRSNSRRMALLVDDLLCFVSLRRQTPRAVRIDVMAMMQSLVDELVTPDRERNVDVHVDEMPDCQSDPDLLRQLLSELLTNALKFSRQRRPAVITVGATQDTERSPDRHVYFVRDNGIGFDPRYTDNIFKLFSRLNLPDAYEGTGAGLAKAQRVAERLGSRLWAESALGEGATFFFSLPAQPRGSHGS